jgi:hypothetical protein
VNNVDKNGIEAQDSKKSSCRDGSGLRSRKTRSAKRAGDSFAGLATSKLCSPLKYVGRRDIGRESLAS